MREAYYNYLANDNYSHSYISTSDPSIFYTVSYFILLAAGVGCTISVGCGMVAGVTIGSASGGILAEDVFVNKATHQSVESFKNLKGHVIIFDLTYYFNEQKIIVINSITFSEKS